jgi:hypothetical protein
MDWTPIVETIATAVVATAAMAVAIAVIRLTNHNANLLGAATEQAEATRALAAETRMDLAIATQPMLVLLDAPPQGIHDEPWAAVRVRNVGTGPALNFVVWMLVSGNLYRSAGVEPKGFSRALHVASGDIFEPGPPQNMLYLGKAHGRLDPGSAVVGESPATNLVAYSEDQFGNRYRFNLHTADPPEFWERGADAPKWAGAWDSPLSSAWPEVMGNTSPASAPERDLSQLIDELHGLLHTLEDAAANDQ